MKNIHWRLQRADLVYKGCSWSWVEINKSYNYYHILPPRLAYMSRMLISQVQLKGNYANMHKCNMYKMLY